jgi:ABC-type transporter MlaC component
MGQSPTLKVIVRAKVIRGGRREVQVQVQVRVRAGQTAFRMALRDVIRRAVMPYVQ